MSPSRLTTLFLLTFIAADWAAAQTVVNSTFHPGGTASWGDANNWSPPEVPNNSPEKNYNVTIPGFVRLNVDATISNLALTGSFLTEDHSLTTTGSTSATNASFNIASSRPAGATVATGSLSSFSEGALTGRYYLANFNATAGWATLQFGGAQISRLSNAQLSLAGPLTRVVDESGNDALRNLSRIDRDSSLVMVGRQFVLTGPLTNEGELSLAAGFEKPMLFSVLGSLTNFDASSHTLTGGTYYVGGYNYAGSNHPALFQFAGADIVRNAAVIGIGPLGKIVDQNGSDALRNFAYNAAAGVFNLSGTAFSTSGNFTNDGVVALSGAAFSVKGSLTNFDPITRTLSGGSYSLDGNFRPSELSFPGADIVNNAASITLIRDARISDEAGKDALRNFAHNLRGGEFTINDSHLFTAGSDFTNAGLVQIAGFEVSPGHFKMTGTHRYIQTEGQTSILDAHFTGRMEIDGGSLSAYGNSFFGNPSVLTGDLLVGDANLVPRALVVEGAVELSGNSRLWTTVAPGVFHPPVFIVEDTFTAAGTLKVSIGNFQVASTEVARLVQSGGIVGAFGNAPNGARVSTTDGRGSFLVTYTPTEIFLSDFQATPPAAQLLNISSRVHVLTGDHAAVAGFIIFGRDPKKVIIRGLGPSLTGSGVGGALANPTLELHGSNGAVIVANDDWQESQKVEIEGSGLAPSDNLEAAIVVTLAPGAYTALLGGQGNTTGTGLVEVYDLATGTKSKIANLSTRGFVEGNNLLIGGFVVGGNGAGHAELVVRAIGPRLDGAGITGFLPDPTLELRDSHGALLAFNDDCDDTPENFQRIDPTLYLFNARDAALPASLPAGNYTALVRGKNNASGIALVEVYDMNR